MVESVIGAVAALGGLGGVATLATAIRKGKEGEPAKEVQPPPPLHDPVRARWSLVLGLCAMACAVAVVVLVGFTSMALDRPPIVFASWGVVAFAALAMATGILAFSYAWRQRRKLLMYYGGAGILASLGSLVATLVVGIG